MREAGTDMFGLGSREAVLAALYGQDRTAFGAPAGPGDLTAALDDAGLSPSLVDGTLTVPTSAVDDRLRALLVAFGWETAGETRGDGSAESRTRLAPLS
ncbi:MAG: hypothetical protein ACJ72D_22080 [Marmoricola sp.]